MVLLYVLSFVLLNTLFIIFTIDGLFLIISFLANLLLISYGLLYSTSKKWMNIDLVIWNFKYIFFVFAPIIQINHGRWPNMMPIEEEKIIYVNLLLGIWSMIYLALRNKKIDIPPAEQFNFKDDRWVRNIYMGLALMLTAVVIGLFGFDFTLGYAGWSDLIENQSVTLLMDIIVSGILFGNVLFQCRHLLAEKKYYALFNFTISLLLLFTVASPFNKPRYYLGFMIITALFLFFRGKVKALQFNFYMVAGIFIIFPLTNFYRFGFAEVSWSDVVQLSFVQFNELHFDAYANIIATIDYVKEEGITYGYQLLGSMLFFIPRNVWETKPLQTGELIGNYLIELRYLDFNNLANALPSEMYVNFGFPGILFGAAAMAIIVNRLEKSARKEFLTYAILAGFIFYIYRGALMSGFAYSFGTIVTIKFFPVFIKFILKKPAANPERERIVWVKRKI